MTIHEEPQGSPEWFAARSGKFTGSNFDKLFMGKSTKGYNDLLNTVAFERLSGVVPESFETDWMARGKELEAEARKQYELETFRRVRTVGFVSEDEWVGASPDGLIDEDGILEVKCPKHTTFMTYLLDPKKAYDEYMYQVQGEMMVTGRHWADLTIYYPGLAPLIIRCGRDAEIINRIRGELATAIEIVQSRIKCIETKWRGKT